MTIVMLVALRLCIGWHFYKEGVKHYQEPDFTSAPFLRQAVGPLAPRLHTLAGGGFHDWEELVARPQPKRDLTKDQIDERTAWAAEQKRKADERKKKASEAQKEADQAKKDAGQSDETKKKYDEAQKKADEAKQDEAKPPVELPPFAPYHDWALQVIEDWDAVSREFLDDFDLNKEQQQEIGDVFYQRKKELVDYLDEQSDAIVDYQHELYRLEQLEAKTFAEEVPYQEKRIAERHAEALKLARGIQADVRTLQQNYLNDLYAVLDDKQRSSYEASRPVSELAKIDKAVTYLTLIVGALLIVGLFTRLASLAGALFLLSVIATQPPWIAGATPTYYQVVEMVALFMLATTPVGRWGGLDFFIHALFSKCCRSTGD